MKYLIVGLGNVGLKYENTRHNIGFMALDAFAEASGVYFKDARYAQIAEHKIKNRTFHLAKPSTLVNLSGKAVRYWVNELKIPLEQILVITDDVDLPLGKLKLKGKGGDAGHNGMKDIIEQLGTQEFPRLRFGIGKNYPKGQQVSYVLGQWTSEEKEIIDPQIEKVTQLIQDFAFQGLSNTMTKYN